MKTITKKLLSKFGIEVKRMHVNHEDSELDYQKKFFEKIGIDPHESGHSFLLQSFNLVEPLVSRLGATIKAVNSDSLSVRIGNIVVEAQSYEDFFIINEVFLTGIYNIVTSQPVVVWDIGMNVGIASLCFAAKENVLAVVGYEPFEDTFEQAKRNFSFNPAYANKIKPHNLGLGRADESLILDYCYQWKGSIGINRLPKLDDSFEYVKREINLISASDALEAILREYPGISVVAKIDCEGGEYDIVDSLFQQNRLKDLDNIMLEWHDAQKNDQLIEQLLVSGFNLIFLDDKDNSSIGTIYASKSK